MRVHRPAATRRLSRTGLQLIANFEGFAATPYNDAAGHATIGYGHLLHYGNVTAADRKRWGSISRSRGLRILRKDAKSAGRAVRAGLRGRKATQGEYDAMLSLAFNIGNGAFGSSTLLRKFRAGDHRGAADQFLVWNKAGGRTLEGLTRRRKAERSLFLRR